MTLESRITNGKTVGSARNAIRILTFLSKQPRPVRLADVTSGLSINSSTCFNILHTLAEDGYVSIRDRTYALGQEALLFAYRALDTLDDLPRVQMLIDRFSRERVVNVLVWRIEDNDAVAIARSSNPSAEMTVEIKPQRTMPVLNGSIGRIVAAFGPLRRDELRAEFERADWRALSFERFLEQADEARESGYAIECGDVVEGIHAVAAPVFAADGSLDRVISVYALASALPPDRIAEIGAALLDLAGANGLRAT